MASSSGEKLAPFDHAASGRSVQAAMGAGERRKRGAHYTSERDILKVLGPLILDDLDEALARALAIERDGRRAALEGLHRRLCRIRVLDPACGCGDFLAVAYRELRRREAFVVESLDGGLEEERWVRLDQFYGIELEGLPAQTARESMARMAAELDEVLSYGPTRKNAWRRGNEAAVILEANALRCDWKSLLAPGDDVFVVGNPPFVGKKEQSTDQREDMVRVWGDVAGAGILDYACGWYRQAARYVEGTDGRVGFLTTSSIAQGEQVGVLWGALLKVGMAIDFACGPFAWESNAAEVARVHVVIVGFGEARPGRRRLLYEPVEGAKPRLVTSISPYLVEGEPVLLKRRPRPLSAQLPLSYGSFALDGGHLILTEAERSELVEGCPRARSFLRLFVGGEELLYGRRRWCLWLEGQETQALFELEPIRDRLEAVRSWRQERRREGTRRLASSPERFAEIRQPSQEYLAIPTVSSAERTHIPLAFLSPDVIASNQLYTLAGAGLWEFGILQSAMHMTWVRRVCGRLKSDYRYSAALVYNNFVWPEADEGSKAAVEEAARNILEIRNERGKTLAELYAPGRMPAELLRAHEELDERVDGAYRPQGFDHESQRLAWLLELYEDLVVALTPV